ncbi:MAG TPA: shikimate dehydrogenase [Clostridiaceae bacterium]|jgi:shikimate dehydrogenase|nr:shikimate dehydrogenase [Clostridiaceae bacterium]
MGKNNLETVRKEIDKVDKELSSLLQKRMDLVSKVVESKAQTGKEVLDKSREEEVIQNVLSIVKKQEYKDNVKAIFECIMYNSREYQKKLLESKSIKPRYAVIGEKLSHSISPQIHRELFEKTNTNASYGTVEVSKSEIPDLLDRLKKEGYKGINVTIPYKTEIMAYLNTISDIVRRTGAVNTVKIGEIYQGYNTDYFGFGKALEYYGFDSNNKVCAVLGSGGASKAVVAWLEDKGASKITIVSRDVQTAASRFPEHESIQISDFSAEGYDSIINATPVGMFPKVDFSPLSKEQLKGASFVMDLIYNPAETLFLKYAKELSIPCANGLYMLVAQAVCAEEIWQGTTYDQDIIDEIYEKFKGSG